MRRRSRSIWIPVALGALVLSGCARGASPEAVANKAEPARVEPVEGTDLGRVVLTRKAGERIGIETAAVGEVAVAGVEAPRKTVPYSAVIYDTHGDTLMYTQADPLVFVRHPITVDRIEGDTAILLDGPPPGTQVVAVGAAELFGIEFGIGK